MRRGVDPLGGRDGRMQDRPDRRSRGAQSDEEESRGHAHRRDVVAMGLLDALERSMKSRSLRRLSAGIAVAEKRRARRVVSDDVDMALGPWRLRFTKWGRGSGGGVPGSPAAGPAAADPRSLRGSRRGPRQAAQGPWRATASLGLAPLARRLRRHRLRFRACAHAGRSQEPVRLLDRERGADQRVRCRPPRPVAGNGAETSGMYRGSGRGLLGRRAAVHQDPVHGRGVRHDRPAPAMSRSLQASLTSLARASLT